MSAFGAGFFGTAKTMMMDDMAADREAENEAKRLAAIDKLEREREARLRKNTKADERIGRDPVTGQMFKEVLNQEGEVIGRRVLTEAEAEHYKLGVRKVKAEVEGEEAKATGAGIEARYKEKGILSDLDSDAQARRASAAQAGASGAYGRQAAAQAQLLEQEARDNETLSIQDRIDMRNRTGRFAAPTASAGGAGGLPPASARSNSNASYKAIIDATVPAEDGKSPADLAKQKFPEKAEKIGHILDEIALVAKQTTDSDLPEQDKDRILRRLRAAQESALRGNLNGIIEVE